MRSFLSLLSILSAVSTVVAVNYLPAAAPLSVKTPYLNTWLHGGYNALISASDSVTEAWPGFGSTGDITGWASYVRVDNVSYRVLGDSTSIGSSGKTQSVDITATQTQIIVRCGGVDVKMTFMNPIEPTDFVRMSLPFSYMTLVVAPNDGQTHQVQVYADLSGEWLSSNDGDMMNWSTHQINGIVYHQFGLVSPVEFGEDGNGRSIYGQAYHGMLFDDQVSYQTGTDVDLRTWFNNTGALNNTQDTNYRTISPNWPVMALSKSLGQINSESSAVTFTLGLVRDPAVSYQTVSGPQSRSLFFRTQLGSDVDALSFFIKDYNTSVASCTAFDNKVNSAASQISGQYNDLAVMAALQTFSHAEITVSNGSDGRPNASDPMVFLGNSGVNKIEHIYASAPFWIWVNPVLLRYLIDPIIGYHRRVRGASNDTPYVADDIGQTYPQALGPSSSALQSPKSLESTADMIIVAAAYIRFSGDKSLVSANEDLFDTWADYLSTNALYPGNQMTSEGQLIGGPKNDTNLAVKSIIALKAYGDVLSSLGKSNHYSDTATSYASQWQNIASQSQGFFYDYADSGSWGMTYNLFVDKWLKTNLFPDSVFQQLTTSYTNYYGTYGLRLNSNSSMTSGAWMSFAAAAVPDTVTRDALISRAQHFLQNTTDSLPWADMYDASNGTSTLPQINNWPTVGGVYALLARDLPQVTSPSSGSGSGSSGAISIFNVLSIRYYTAIVFALFTTVFWA